MKQRVRKMFPVVDAIRDPFVFVNEDKFTLSFVSRELTRPSSRGERRYEVPPGRGVLLHDLNYNWYSGSDAPNAAVRCRGYKGPAMELFLKQHRSMLVNADFIDAVFPGGLPK